MKTSTTNIHVSFCHGCLDHTMHTYKLVNFPSGNWRDTCSCNKCGRMAYDVTNTQQQEAMASFSQSINGGIYA